MVVLVNMGARQILERMADVHYGDAERGKKLSSLLANGSRDAAGAAPTPRNLVPEDGVQGQMPGGLARIPRNAQLETVVKEVGEQ
jgi:hypothetical protein